MSNREIEEKLKSTIMASKSLLALVLVFSSFVYPGSSKPDLSNVLQSLTQGSMTSLRDSMKCMQKLLPCQQFFKNPSNPPPSTCCLPLKVMMANDIQCLCQFLNDPQLLRSLNITKDDALKLPKACAMDADVSKCQKEASPPTSAATDKNSTVVTVPTANTTDSSGSTKQITPNGIIHFGVASFAALMISLLISA